MQVLVFSEKTAYCWLLSLREADRMRRGSEKVLKGLSKIKQDTLLLQNKIEVLSTASLLVQYIVFAFNLRYISNAIYLFCIDKERLNLFIFTRSPIYLAHMSLIDLFFLRLYSFILNCIILFICSFTYKQTKINHP